MAIPTRISLSKLAVELPTTIDLFICSASYEDRCLSIPFALGTDSIANAFVCANDDFTDHLSGNLEKLMSYFGERAIRVHLRQNNPVFGLDNLYSALMEKLGSTRQQIVVDATTFTHEGLLILVRLLAALLSPGDEVTVLYAPASEYAVGSPDNEKWLSRGLGEIRSVLGFPGSMVPARKLHMIVLVGFEVERARLLIDACEPDVISLGRGRDSTDVAQVHLPVNIDTLRQLAVHYPDFEEFGFSCVDWEATYSELVAQVRKFPDHNTIVAPMNTKLSTIGAAVFALLNTDVQLCYAPALTYNFPGYSKPSEYCLLSRLQLPLERKATL